MVSNSNRPEQSFASQVASELNQPTRGKGVDRLAAALVEAVNADITEEDGAARLAELPGATWVYVAALVGYTPGSKYANKNVRYSAQVSGLGSVDIDSSVSILDAVERAEKEYGIRRVVAVREAAIRERVEREMKEAEAAEKAEQATAPLAFRPDGSPADVLPVEPFDGVSPADGGGVR